MRNKNENSRKLSGNFSRALLKAQAIGMLIAWLTINKKVNKKPNSIPEETFET